ncbi:MAG TPA: DUF4412 domain-containing protein [Thermodesulfobacteriota bacterium]|nr:DUF4412 domain-containing protein [Thermodesulfobacteriota bacterium]
MHARVKVIFTLAVLFVFAGFENDAHSGLIMEQVGYQQGSNDRQKVTIYIQDDKFKQVENGGPFSPAVIFDLNSGDIMFVNDEKKLYIILNRDEYLKYIESVITENKDVSTVSRNITLKKTDETAAIAGYSARKYEIFDNDKLQSEYWVSSDAGFSEELDMNKMSKLMNEVKRISQNVGGSASISDNEYKIFQEIYEDGYPMKTVYHSPDGDKVFVEEIVTVKKQNIPPSEFEPPAGYEKITYQDILKQQ